MPIVDRIYKHSWYNGVIREKSNSDEYGKELAPDTRNNYTIPVMKYWKYSVEDLKEQKMYALLPLQVFKSRKSIQAIYRSQKTDIEKSRLITVEFILLKDIVQETVTILGQLHDQQEIPTGDLERILRVLQNINEYLYQQYGEYQKIEEEVYQMVKTLYDPRVKQEGIKKDEINQLLVDRASQ